ncbi:hypothetical protein Tco_1425855 [Tanacetum coccineum]
MAYKETKSTMREFAANEHANYYSGITGIMVNGKNAYELKGKFLDDLHMNAFSGTHREDAVEHIKYFLKLVYPIDLPNVNQDKLRVVVFPISLAEDAWRWFDGIKGSITCWVDLTAKFFGDNITRLLTLEKLRTFKNQMWPTYSWKEDGYCNGENLPVGYIVGNTLHCQDLEWYDALKDNAAIKMKSLKK